MITDRFWIQEGRIRRIVPNQVIRDFLAKLVIITDLVAGEFTFLKIEKYDGGYQALELPVFNNKCEFNINMPVEAREEVLLSVTPTLTNDIQGLLVYSPDKLNDSWLGLPSVTTFNNDSLEVDKALNEMLSRFPVK